MSLADYTTFKTGGAAEYFVSVTTPEELKAAVDFAVAAPYPGPEEAEQDVYA